MFEAQKFNGTDWESFSVRVCIHIYAPELIELAAKDSTIIQLPISETGKYYITIPYRITEDDQDRLLYSNIFEVINNQRFT
jgi:hypothetical protein